MANVKATLLREGRTVYAVRVDLPRNVGDNIRLTLTLAEANALLSQLQGMAREIGGGINGY